MEKEAKKISINVFLIVAFIAGSVSAVLHFLFTGLLFYFNLISRFSLQDAGAIIYRTTEMPLDMFSLFIASIAFVLWGGMLALGLAFIYLFTGKNYYLAKGILYGFIMMIVIRNFLASMTIPGGLPPQDAITNTVMFTAHFLWGGLTGLIIVGLIPFEDEAKIIIRDRNTPHEINLNPAPALKPFTNKKYKPKGKGQKKTLLKKLLKRLF